MHIPTYVVITVDSQSTAIRNINNRGIQNMTDILAEVMATAEWDC